MQYAVVFTYSFDKDAATYLFEDVKEAKKFLVDNYKEELRVDVQENGFLTTGFITDDYSYASITNIFEDHEDTTTMYFCNVYDHDN